MTVATLRPDGTEFTHGTVTLVGAASAHVATNDNSDASYAQTSTTSGEMVRLTLGTVAVPALAQIRSVTPRIRLSTVSGSAQYRAAFMVLVGGVQGASNIVNALSATIETFVGAIMTSTPSGGAWTQSALDALVFRFDSNYYNGVSALKFFEAYADVLYNEAPVATVTAPGEGSSVTTTTRPTVSWTYSDPESDAQDRYRVKIFSAAQYGAGGFNPDTSTATYDSGEVVSSATSHNVPIDLVNGTTYRAYVKVADSGSSGRYGAWDNNTFTINVTPPPAPNLVVTAQPTDASGPRVKLDITRTSSATPTTYMVIEFSDDTGTTWKTLRGASNIVNSPDGTTFTFYDYEMKPGNARSYRAKAVRTV